jgi:heat shock protein HslJ
MHRELHIESAAWILAVVLLSGTLLAGCGGPAETKGTPTETASTAPGSGDALQEATTTGPGGPLADTDWYLFGIQSMDDAVGTVRPEDPFLYTMRLNADGTVTMRLNCNRANSTWTIEPSADPTNGSFEFGPLAMTRALCPPPSLDERVAAQAEYVRGYMLQDSRLYLSLMADGGILVWEAQVPFETVSDDEIEAAILQASPDYTRAIVDIDGRTARYLYSRVDLNGDGRDEVLVYLLGSVFCGSGGCNLLLFTDTGDGYALVNTFPISRTPVIVSAETTNGWNNLIRLESGGGAEASYVTHTFDGERYVESERVSADTAPEGTRVLAGEFTFEDGIPLEPRD